MMRFLIILLFVCSFGGLLDAQELNTTEVWTSYSVKYAVNKKWKVYGEAQYRFNNHSDLPQPFFLEFGGRKKINKVSSIKLQYRYTWVNGERNTQRLALDGRFKWKVLDKKTVLQYRTRAQVERVAFNGQITSDWRNKIGIVREFSKKFDLYLDYESFIRLLKLKSFLHVDSPKFNKNRFTLGGKYTFKKNEFKAFYRLDQSVDYSQQISHVFGFGMVRKLK
ncbi:MAG: hypothetical protein ACJA2N_001099 [Salibacteraceae bacterium]|jgi:hypothetical protein